ncbi:MAG TPA: cation-translocating P-type ATPase [Nitrososphaerales archaeon]|nr:cation-translocating P-type ATPase [Nitrososphaerales archaeon]
MTDEPESESVEPEGGNTRADRVRLVVMAIAAVTGGLGVWSRLLPVDVVSIAASLLGGYPVYKETFLALRHGRVNMEVSMAVAIFASLLVGQYTVSVVITFFVLLSEYIETYAVDRGRQTITLLEESAPKLALVRRAGKELEVEAGTLVPNDVVIVRDGDRVPVDGTIVVGSAFLNQSSITGESARVEKTAGDSVYAGSVDESGVIEVRTERVGTETVFGKIIKLVEDAENRKAPIQKLSDRLAAWLVEFAIGFSALTLLVTRDITSALSVVVVAGACGVAAGTPLAIVAIMGKAAKRGTIVKGGAYIEEMSRVDTVVIDKTGTLTFGEPEVSDVVGFDGCSARQVLEYAAAAERYSSHPLARAIMGKAAESGIELASGAQASSSNYIAGKGVVTSYNGGQVIVGSGALMKERGVGLPASGEELARSERMSKGKSTVMVAYQDRVCGVIAVADKVRGESKRALEDLKGMGIRTVMLTGDNKTVARQVADEVGIDEVYAELLPQDKVSIVERLVAEGHKVAMVGDGINDAPALARANVGIGMGAGTDVAIEEADIVLMTNDLQKIADVARLSRKAYRTIMVNFYGTLTVDGLGVSLAFLGLLNPLLAAAIHVTSELIFILNSARLIR